jgi:acetate kinase
VAKRVALHLGRPLPALNLITLHLGNGASASAILKGVSVDTSMGMTPLEGLVMGTRCGDLDPAVPFYLGRATGRSPAEIEALLNKGSGLKGICGANDMREILRMADLGEPLAQLALDIYCYRIKKYIGAYLAVLGRLDALVFTGGIGENAAPIRRRCCQGLEGLGITVEDRKNEKACDEVLEIQRDGSPVKVLAIRTKEEREIAEQTVATLLRAREGGGKAP